MARLNDPLLDMAGINAAMEPDAAISAIKAFGRQKVLVKGPWDGYREDYWELSDDEVERFVEAGIAYGLCAFEAGEPKYSLVKRNLWEEFDDLAVLSEEERNKRISELLRGE